MSNALRKHKRHRRSTSIISLGQGESVRVEGGAIVITGPTKTAMKTAQRVAAAEKPITFVRGAP